MDLSRRGVQVVGSDLARGGRQGLVLVMKLKRKKGSLAFAKDCSLHSYVERLAEGRVLSSHSVLAYG